MKNQVILELNEQNRKACILERAKVIVSQNKVVRERHNLWIVTSSNPKLPEMVYFVCFDYALDCFTCTCPHYEHKAEICKHIVAVAIYQRSSDQ